MKYNKDNPLRCFFAFEGYNSQGLALDRIKQRIPGFDWICVGRSEIDRYAIQAANAIFPENADKNYGDISKIDWSQVPDFDLFTYSFPCFTAGTLVLTKDGFKEIEDITESDEVITHTNQFRKVVKPMINAYKGDLYHINAMAFHGIDCTPEHPFYVRKRYKKWEQYLAALGYDNHCKVINATECGIPQNRERIFIFSILNNDKAFHFQEPIPLETRLKDVLEQEVDDKYVLSDQAIDGFLEHNKNHEEKGTGFI